MNALSTHPRKSRGFSLFEVVLAVGVLSVSILALLGLFGPTMSSVRDVVDNNEANGVRTRLNAALMSDEIYSSDALDLSDLGTRFTEFAGKLSDPDEGQPLLLFFWNERDALSDPLVLKYSDDPTDMGDISLVEGSAFVVALEQGMQGNDDDPTQNYDFDNVQSQGHFPILVSIYAIAPTDLETKSAQDFTDMVNDVSPIFTYTTAKLR